MGVDYYTENEEISEFEACAAKILEQYSPEQWAKARQECAEHFRSLCEDEDFKKYAAGKNLSEEISEILANAEHYTYDSDGEWTRYDWYSWIAEAFDLYMKVYDAGIGYGESTDNAAGYWKILVENSSIPGIEDFKEAGIVYLDGDKNLEDLQGISVDTLYLCWGFKRYKKALTKKAKSFVGIFGKENLPEDCSWIWVSC